MSRERVCDSNEALADLFNSIVDDDCVMVAVWTLRDGKQNMKRLTRNFPSGEFDKSVGMLASDLNSERSILAAEAILNDPLPVAEEFQEKPTSGQIVEA